MKIHSVAQGKDYFFIYTDDGTGIVQRKHTLFAADPWLTSDEETIVALCHKICGTDPIVERSQSIE